MNAYESLNAADQAKVDNLLAETESNGGLAPVNLEMFWADQESARRDPFGDDIPQVPLGAVLNWECVFDELGLDVDYRRFQTDPAWAAEVSRRYNDIAERIVGRRLLNEAIPVAEHRWPAVKGLHEIFEAENVWEGGPSGSWWLKQAASTPDELRALLDRVERRLENLREFLLPENWTIEKDRLTSQGLTPPLYRWQRGPCTFVCSIFGAENMIFLCIDEPELAVRFGDLILHAILGRARIMDEEAGYDVETAPHGWGWADDNCCLFNPAMYEQFGWPILKGVFDRYSPNPTDRRYQHSDSNMAHLLPLLGKLNLTGTNFGPTLTVREIRKSLPIAVIEGQLAPFTYCRNERANIVAEFLRDFTDAQESRGLVFATAGSINNGSRLTSMRLAMSAIQRFGRFC